MKKIGILTFSYGCNFGGTLQCLGLYKALQIDSNKKIVVIDYIPEGSYSFLNKKINGCGITLNIKKSLKNMMTNPGKILKSLYLKNRFVEKSLDKFNEFRSTNLKLVPYSSQNIEKNIDTIIVGSDQVWNVTGRFNPVYFLENIQSVNKISYAACSGSDFYKEEDKESLKNTINDFNHISVRNMHTHNFVKRLTEKEAAIVCDPSILYNYKEYLNQEKPKEKYILTYILGSEINGGHKKVLEQIKKKVGDIKVIAVGIVYSGSGSLQFYPWADEVLYDASPEDWLNLINNAEFIYTDSYHGVLFSMKFHKKFLSYYAEKGRASRFIDLADRYAVGDWIVNSVDEMYKKNSLGKEVDYEKVDNLLSVHREYSMNFLKKALGEKDE